jgi:hypothetical protein
MTVAKLIGGPAHGEHVTIGSGTQVIEVDLGEFGFASYSENFNGYWRFDAIKPQVGTACARTPGFTRSSDASG